MNCCVQSLIECKQSPIGICSYYYVCGSLSLAHRDRPPAPR
ncbi:MAG: hypothetical protein RLZZ148_1841, partial [Cyanobacteriota bacterium]